MMTLTEMLERSVAAAPDKTAVTFKDTRLSYRELRAQARALAAYLTSSGLDKGGKVGVLLEKTPEAIVALLGVAEAGGVFFTIDHNQVGADIQYVLDTTRPSALIVHARFLHLLSGLRVPCPQRVVVVGGAGPHSAWEDIVSGSGPQAPTPRTGGEDLVYLNFTSGTTGTPKGALTTHANIYWNTVSSVETLGLTADDVHLCMFPICGHPHELFARPFFLGGTLVLTDGVSPKAIAGAIAGHGVTCMMATASIYLSLARFCRAQNPDLGSVRLGESGGMHITPGMAEEFESCFTFPVVPVWGSTETTGIALASDVAGRRKPGSVGRPCAHYEVGIVDDEGKACGVGETGEMIVRGYGVCSGYYANEAETRKHMRDGWLHTGDLFRTDVDGDFFFAGRRTRMIKVAGLKVFPTELEDTLSCHPDIEEVAVIGAPDRSHGEVPQAFVVPREGAYLSSDDVRRYCAGCLARYKMPRVVEVVSELPKSRGGKVLYRELAARAAQRAAHGSRHRSGSQGESHGN